jgi:hypothetical protein
VRIAVIRQAYRPLGFVTAACEQQTPNLQPHPDGEVDVVPDGEVDVVEACCRVVSRTGTTETKGRPRVKTRNKLTIELRMHDVDGQSSVHRLSHSS